MARSRALMLFASIAMLQHNFIAFSVAAPSNTASPYIAMAANNPNAWIPGGQHVEYAISVVEDSTASFAEFPSLKSGVLMVSDSDAMLAALRIMEKHQLAKSVSAPRITCAVGEHANMSTGLNAAQKTIGNSDGCRVEVASRAVQSGPGKPGVSIEVTAEARQNGVAQDAAVGCLVKEGQTAVIKLGHVPVRKSDGTTSQMYVVVTPKLIK